jgi:hypothetical protein
MARQMTEPTTQAQLLDSTTYVALVSATSEPRF